MLNDSHFSRHPKPDGVILVSQSNPNIFANDEAAEKIRCNGNMHCLKKTTFGFFCARKTKPRRCGTSTTEMGMLRFRRFNNNTHIFLTKYIPTVNQDEIDRELSSFSFTILGHAEINKNEGKNTFRKIQQENSNGGNVGNNADCVKERNYISYLVQEMMDNSPEEWTLNGLVLFASLIAVGGVFLLVCCCILYASCCGKGGGRRTESKNHWDERLRRSEQKNYDYKSYGVAKFSDGAVAADCEYVLSEDDNNRI
mmetsp:Transcript_21343/g.40429  ORF Transcript_21343/g.40429 Transcript_21343/m.40429 type:complete len:254 (+) Transcript_21343:115-876(+)